MTEEQNKFFYKLGEHHANAAASLTISFSGFGENEPRKSSEQALENYLNGIKNRWNEIFTKLEKENQCLSECEALIAKEEK